MSVGGDSGVQSGVEGVAGLVLFAVDRVDEADGDLCSLVDDELPRRWWRRSLNGGLIVGRGVRSGGYVVRTRRRRVRLISRTHRVGLRGSRRSLRSGRLGELRLRVLFGGGLCVVRSGNVG